MKRLIAISAAMLLFATALFGCSPAGDLFDHAGFVALLEANGFAFEQLDEGEGLLSGCHRVLSLGKELLSIYAYRTSRAMERNAGYVCRGGSTITLSRSRLSRQTLHISWVSTPHWFKRDTIIVRYVGKNQDIIDFLSEHLTFFAGHNNPS